MLSFNINASKFNIENEVNNAIKNYVTEKDSKEKIIKLVNYLIEDDSSTSAKNKIDMFVKLEKPLFYFALLPEIHNLGKEGIKLSSQNNNYKMEYFYYYKGVYEEEKGFEYEHVIKTYKKSLKYSLIHENIKKIKRTYEAIGDIYSYDKNIKLAFDNYKMASKYVSDKKEDIMLKHKISKIFYFFNVNVISYEESLKLLKEIEYENDNKNKNKNIKEINNLKIYIYENLSLISVREKKYEKALLYAEKRFEQTHKIDDIYEKIMSLLLSSFVNSHLNNFEESLEKITIAEEHIKNEGDILQYLFYNLKYTKFHYFYLKNEYENAEKEILELEFYLKKESNNQAALYSIYDKISMNLSKLGKHKKALNYQKKYTKDYIKNRNVEETSLSLFLHENYKAENLLNENNKINILKEKNNKQIIQNEKEDKYKSNLFRMILLLIIVSLLSIFILRILYLKHKKISITDDLTGLYNRGFFISNTKKEMDNNEVISIVITDIDNFKKINDSYGHDVGDRILIEFANILKKNTNNEEVVSRIGGEEFMIVYKDNEINSREKVEKIRKEIEDYQFSNNIRLTSSFGIANSKKGNFNEICLQADKNLYKAKESGKNKII
jgi:diguanylate cyclase (GGDEF)-like protein